MSWDQSTEIQILALPLRSFVTLSKLLKLSVPQNLGQCLALYKCWYCYYSLNLL